MFEKPPGWTADKERERIRNLTDSYYGAKKAFDEETARARKIEEERIAVLIWGTLIALGGLATIHWFVGFLVAAFLVFYWFYGGRELCGAKDLAALRREEMRRLRELLEQVGLSPHSPWTVEKDGQVLGFVPRYEPEL